MSTDTPSQPPTSQFHHAFALDKHTQQALLKPNKGLSDALQNSKANGLPDISISPLQGQQLSILCRLINAKTVLELGTLGGYSTIWFAQTGAKVTSIEINPQRRDVALQNINKLGLDVDVILGAGLDVMSRLVSEDKVFDFVFIDASWDEQWEYFELAVKLTRKGGCIYVDNVVRELLESDCLSGGKESLVTKIGRDDRVTATLVPTVGAHKELQDMFDGYVLAIMN